MQFFISYFLQKKDAFINTEMYSMHIIYKLELYNIKYIPFYNSFHLEKKQINQVYLIFKMKTQLVFNLESKYISAYSELSDPCPCLH